MDVSAYQNQAARTRNPALDPEQHLANAALGLAGETGEIVEQIKKHLFQGHDLDHASLAKELGDVLWYLADLATTLDMSLSLVASQNISKLRERYGDSFDPQRSRERTES